MIKTSGLMIIGTIILFIIFVPIGVYHQFKDNKYCESQGFQFSSKVDGLEPGYTKCCNKVYVDHIETKQCEVIPHG